VLAQIQPTDRNEDRLALQARQDPDTLGRLWAASELARGVKEGQSISKKAQATLVEVISSDPSPYARIAILQVLRASKTRWLPGTLAEGVVAQAKATQSAEFEKSAFFTADPQGARLVRAELVGALGKIEDGDAAKLLAGLLARKDLPLDELTSGSLAYAQLGTENTEANLKEALKTHSPRGYAYAYAVQFAYGAFESPQAATAIAEFAKTGSTDLIGRIGWIVRDNQTLKTSAEWAQFVQTFVVGDTRFGDEVKSRILETVE
jgi:hypothetical protein